MRPIPLLLLCTLLLLGRSSCAEDPEKIPIIDCHVHLWKLERPEGLGWIDKDNKTLFRDYLPEHHAPIAKANGVKAVVLVQAGQSLPDNQWNLDVTADNADLYRGVVGNLSLAIGTDKFKPLFESLCKDKRYVGYRLSGRYQEKLTDELYRDLTLTAEAGKTVDFLVGGYSLEDVAAIAQRVPDLKIIIDHFGNLRLDGQPLDRAWVKQFRAVAQHQNVYCKFSALYGRVDNQPAPQDINYYKPVIDLAFECFGEDRLVYGSDWPVTRTTGDYASVVKLTRDYLDAKGPKVSEKVFSQNAMEFYGISLRRTVELPGMKIDLQNRLVDLEGSICLDRGYLELIACTKGTKEHESIIAVTARPMHIHTALLLLGSNNGNPAMYKPVDEERTRWVNIPPKGDPVDVYLVFKNKAGKQVEHPISDFVVRAEDRDGFGGLAEDRLDENGQQDNAADQKFPHTFLFAGSQLVGDGPGPRKYLSDLSGNVISIATFGDELLCLPGVYGHENGSLMWEVNATHLPAVGTKITLRLRPQLTPAATAEQAGDTGSDGAAEKSHQ